MVQYLGRNCGNGAENTWIHRLRVLAQYFDIEMIGLYTQ